VATGDPVQPARHDIVTIGDKAPFQAGEALGHSFRHPDLLRQALTHPSVVHRRSAQESYERLEFLGDRVLGLIVADLLFATYPAEPEGKLAQRLAALVRKETLADVAREIDLGSALVLSRGEEESGGRDNPANLANGCEAVIGALYLDGGLEAARQFVCRHWVARLEAARRPPRDAKTSLKEWAQGQGRPLPRYRVVDTSGPPHNPTFAVEVSVEGVSPVVAHGSSKRAAEQAAAALLLETVAA